LDWLNARGVPLLLDVAQQLPYVRFRLCWRPWGDAFESVRSQIEKRGLSHVELIRGKVADMSREYHQCHMTVAPFTDISLCKPMPNSLIESLACGRPVVATNMVGLSQIIREEQCGLVCPTSIEGLAEAIEQVGANVVRYGQNARRIAEKWFSERRFIESYQGVYAAVLNN
jgi:glycosyltransferase involved in cell wall biosynthesis